MEPIYIVIMCFFQLFLITAHCKPQVPCFFIFGDSIVDNGNNNDRQTVFKANFLPYGTDFPDGPTGRYTNGRNLADIIAELLGFDEYIPPYAKAKNRDFLRGVNYASSGAGILDQSGRNYGDIISLDQQLSNHESTVSQVKAMFRDHQKAQEFLGTCIYSVGFGSNDYLLNYLPKFYNSTNKFNPQEFASFLMSKFSGQLQRLYRTGARKVAVFALGKLGCVPGQIAIHGASPGSRCVETIDIATAPFNEKLQILIGALNTKFLDARFVYTKANTTSYGRIRVLDRPCCVTVGANGGCVAGSTPCKNRDEYMFWDSVHPTEAAYSIFARAAYREMAPLYSPPVETW